jgi:hypothetical protein
METRAYPLRQLQETAGGAFVSTACVASRHAYELAYASQRETKYDRALRRARKLRLGLGADPADDEYPDKPLRMRWATYNRLMDRLIAADAVTDERLKTAKAIVDQGRP